MNAEKLQDALNQLPDDLIAATDALRQQKKQPIQWKRLVSIAACLALVLGALYMAAPFLGRKSVSQESMVMQDAAMPETEIAGAAENCAPWAEAEEAESPMEPALDETGRENKGAPLAPNTEEQTGSSGSTGTPVVCYGYCIGAEEPDETQIAIISTAGEWDAYLKGNLRLADAEGFENRYGEEYFAKNQLIAVVTTAASSSVRYELDAIRRTGTGTWELTGTRYTPEEFTEDMTQQCILVELPRVVEPEDIITLNLETERG